MLRSFYILLIISVFAALYARGQSSVLKSGDWYKIGVVQSGMYRIDRNALSAIGINPDAIDPRKIQLYGNGGGGMLPQANHASRPTGLQQNAIVVVGEEDGTFGTNDYILFYGNSPDRFDLGANPGEYNYQKNLYSDTTFYFLTIGDTNGKRVTNLPAINANGRLIDQTVNYVVHERDLSNMIRSGREWIGELFNFGADRTRQFDFQTPGRSAGNVRVETRVVGRSPQGSTFAISSSGVNLGEIRVQPFLDEQYGDKGAFASGVFNIVNASAGASLNIQVVYNSSGTLFGHLDRLVITYPRRLDGGQGILFFHDEQRISGTKTYELQGLGADHQIWDITTPINPVITTITASAGRSRISVNESGIHRYVAFTPAQAIAPVNIRRIPNQDLFSLGAVDGVYVSHPFFVEEARRLASFRAQHDGLNIAVVTTDQVYNDFSSGMQDVSAIRDFARYHYQSSAKKLQYLLLFGDASYDYKKRLNVDNNFVPIYQSRNSTHAIFSYSSDDYFGFLDDHEGEWEERDGGDHLLDIGVGRLVVKSPQEASNVVNKIIRYSTSTNRLGDWRKKIYFVADDGDFNIHLRHAEQLAQYMDTANSAYSLRKVYIDAYPQVSQGGIVRVPQATDELLKAIEDGAFVINYTGHGNEGLWARENIITSAMIPELRNRVRLPLLVTATCEFGNYDNPDLLSGGEQMLLNPEGGAIGLLTTTRAVFAHTNLPVNEAFYRSAFRPIGNRMPRLGDIIKATKNASLRGPVNRNFALLGDPTLTLAYPANTIELVNNGNGNLTTDTIKALGTYKLSGVVKNGQGQIATNFTGNVYIEVTDKPVSKSTLGDESIPTTYLERASALFRGEASVSNGRFNFEFVVPKNISYVPDRGKISMYAMPYSGFEDGSGAEINIIVGGSATNVAPDNRPPTLTGYINNENFVNGATVGNNPLLLVKVEDENGVTLTTTGIGQHMTIKVDDQLPVMVSNFYTADKDTYQSGWIRYPLGNLSEGFHQVEINVWDTHNNLATTTVEFYVGARNAIIINELVNFPNPMTDQTTFSFSHDREGEGLKVNLLIISLSGQKIMEREYLFDEVDTKVDIMEWDGRNDNGVIVNNGIYIYKISVQSLSDGAKNEAFEKLIILN